jgi:hypothetical protein
MTPTRRRGLVVAAVLTLTLGTITAASAYWTGSGAGSGSGSTATTVAVTLSAGTPVAALAPGGQAGVTLTVTNPNSFSVRVVSLALDTSQGTSGFAVDGPHSGCGLGALSFTTQTNSGSGWTIAGGGKPSITLTNALSMAANADNACQGASFTVYLTAGP